LESDKFLKKVKSLKRRWHEKWLGVKKKKWVLNFFFFPSFFLSLSLFNLFFLIMGKNDTKHNKNKAETTFAQKSNKKHTKPNNNINNNNGGNKTSKSLQQPHELLATEDTDKLREQILSLGGTRGDVTFLQDIDNDDSADLITSTDDQSAVSTVNGFHLLLYKIDLQTIISFLLLYCC
jgi:hypothetical protein